MPRRFHILGADQATREPVEVTIIAADEAAARADAAARGVIPIGIESLGETKTAPRPEPEAARIDRWPVVLIERTAKRWKALAAASAVLICTGFVLVAWAATHDPRALTDPAASVVVGAVLSALGFLTLVFARIGAWWYHG